MIHHKFPVDYGKRWDCDMKPPRKGFIFIPSSLLAFDSFSGGRDAPSLKKRQIHQHLSQ